MVHPTETHVSIVFQLILHLPLNPPADASAIDGTLPTAQQFHELQRRMQFTAHENQQLQQRISELEKQLKEKAGSGVHMQPLPLRAENHFPPIHANHFAPTSASGYSFIPSPSSSSSAHGASNSHTYVSPIVPRHVTHYVAAHPSPLSYPPSDFLRADNGHDAHNCLEAAERALRLAPNDITALVSKGDALKQLGRIEESFECFEMALKTSINPSALRGKIENQFILGRHQETLQTIDFMLRYYPNDPTALDISSKIRSGYFKDLSELG